ncbi:3-methyl-2-oxobutanoate hydroxymethyltransferase, partial [Mesorhizobium sp. M7A.F.Ca.CA.001.05.1.1]
MARIFDFGGREVERSVTVAGLRALKGSGRRIAQVTAETAEEAAAAEAAGIEMVVCRAANVPRVREGSRRVFVTAALGFADAVTSDEILRTAFSAITAGADAVITGRGLDTVRMLANEQIPVMGHLGFVPRKSTWVGGIRAVGKTSAEALDLWDRFRRLEDAGAFAVECEIIAAEVMAEINRRTSLVTVSLGSGAEADVVFLFTSDICGESAR